MTNLLADPLNWLETRPGAPASAVSWNGQSYTLTNPPGETDSFFLEFADDVAVITGDTFAGSASTTYTGGALFLNLIAGGAVVRSIALSAAPAWFSVPAIQAGGPGPTPPPVAFVLADSATSTSAATNAGQNVTLTADEAVSYNCDCDDSIIATDTLVNLRRRLLRRLGYSAQAMNPPPGMAALLDDFIVSGQRLLFNRYEALRQPRIFSWNLSPGTRFYDVQANRGACRLKLDPRRIEWAGISDGESNWTPLVYGVRPEWYSHPQSGRPFAYEIRNCIELWPFPASSNYVLRIKGHVGLMPLENDGDITTIDAEAVFLQALATAKAHYKHQDASVPADLLRAYMRDLTAASHGTARYLPGGVELLNHPLPRKA